MIYPNRTNTVYTSWLFRNSFSDYSCYSTVILKFFFVLNFQLFSLFRNLTVIERVNVTEFSEVDGGMKINSLFLLNTVVTSGVQHNISRLLVALERDGCLYINGVGCIKLLSQIKAGRYLKLDYAVCHTCMDNAICMNISSIVGWRCVKQETTEVATTTEKPPKLDFIIGMAVGIPLGTICIFLLIIMAVSLCRISNYRGRLKMTEEHQDLWNVREAFGSTDSLLRGKGSIPTADKFDDIINKRYLGNWENIDDVRTLDDVTEGGESAPPRYEGPQPSGSHSAYISGAQSTCDSYNNPEQAVSSRSAHSWNYLFNILDPRKNFQIKRPLVSSENVLPEQFHIKRPTLRKRDPNAAAEAYQGNDNP